MPQDQDTPRCGVRATYKRGCRCLRCRVANAQYVRIRRVNPASVALVSAVPVVEHLAKLAELGVGHRQASRLSGVSVSEIRKIRSGRRPALKPETAGRLLAIRVVLAPGQRVKAWPTWRLIHSLQTEGYTLGSLAMHLGLRSAQLQLDHGRVTVRNAVLVRKLHARLTAEGPEVTA